MFLDQELRETGGEVGPVSSERLFAMVLFNSWRVIVNDISLTYEAAGIELTDEQFEALLSFEVEDGAPEDLPELAL